MRDEYPADLIKSGVCGKYAERYREGSSVVLTDPGLKALFRDTDAANCALRAYGREHDLLT